MSSAKDGDGAEKEAKKAQGASEKYLDTAYQGFGDVPVAKLIFALRSPDYGSVVDPLLQALDAADRTNPHYLGWARHSDDDALFGAP